MISEYAWMHGAVCTALFLLCFLLLRSRRWWYLAAGLYLVNIMLVLAYVVIGRMTGTGFNEAALYYILAGSWKDVALLWAYAEVRYGVPILLVLLWLFIWGVRTVRLPALMPASVLTQGLLVLCTAGFGLYMTPLTADVLHVMRVAGIDKEDRIGLQDIVDRIDVPEPVDGPKKNLILVYAESMEQPLFDEALFPGLLPRLNRLAGQGMRFDRIDQSPMSNWTIAGMIATQCGVPLSSHRIRNEYNDFGKFSSGYQCLSNHLARQGYTRVYMGGASLGFAGKGDFYRSMGFDEVLGLEELARPESPLSKWGLYDDELLPLVQKKLETLRAGSDGKPFALVMLTLDSHPPSGFASPSCERLGLIYGDGLSAHMNAIRCTDELLGEFMERVIRENIHDSTVVMLSDHVMMGSEVKDALVAKNAVQRNHMVIWDKDLAPGVVRRPGSQFDVGPTVLHALLGKSWQVGFGTSLMDHARSNLTERYGAAVIEESLYAWRTESWQRW